MQLARISSQKQITIPSKLFRKLKLDIGDHIGITEENGTLVLRPYKLIPKDQLWYWTKEWQEMEREADEDIAAGRVSGPFTTVEEFMKDLKA
ncbi:AbrB/MazE/SpoVT family DNA-binding domain-containing protein [Candidatus Uhrbacteria bacterium]|nr:AbrB/MazE/SpoVT family DNA-binding domain-containing protein [Candidatus Uhrbacteria bacterium]